MLTRASSLVFDIPSTLFSMTFRRSTVPYVQPLREAAQKWMLDLARVSIFLALADLISIRLSCLVLPCDTREHKETVFGKHLRYQHLVSQHEALVDSVRMHFGHLSSFMELYGSPSRSKLVIWSRARGDTAQSAMLHWKQEAVGGSGLLLQLLAPRACTSPIVVDKRGASLQVHHVAHLR